MGHERRRHLLRGEVLLVEVSLAVPHERVVFDRAGSRHDQTAADARCHVEMLTPPGHGQFAREACRTAIECFDAGHGARSGQGWQRSPVAGVAACDEPALCGAGAGLCVEGQFETRLWALRVGRVRKPVRRLDARLVAVEFDLDEGACWS